MNTQLKKTQALVPLLSLTTMLLVAGCGDDGTGPWDVAEPQDFSHQTVWRLEVEPPASSLLPGEELRMVARWRNEDSGLVRPMGPTEGVQWESGNPKVASISKDGRVVAHGPGMATITATELIRTYWGYTYPSGEEATARVEVR